MTDAEIRSFLEAARTGVLSTLGADGLPHMAGMWFVVNEGDIEMWTYGKSQKAVNLRRDPRCAFLVESGVAYTELSGILVRGRAELETDVERVYAIGRALYERYTLPATGVPPEEGPDVEIRRQAEKRIGIRLPLDRVASWDHSKL